jgi:hypothetical protein
MWTVRIINSLLGSARFVGPFKSEEAANMYASGESLRSRKFVAFEVWTGTPQNPGRPATYKCEGVA